MSATAAQKAAQKKWKAENRAKLAAYARAWRAKNPKQAKANFSRWLNKHPNNARLAADLSRKHQYARKYGITIEQYDALFAAQNGVCAICSQPQGKRRLAVDHCHTTKAVRGILCVNCNTALGQFNDDPELLRRAIAYLFFYQ